MVIWKAKNAGLCDTNFVEFCNLFTKYVLSIYNTCSVFYETKIKPLTIKASL